MDWLMVTWPVAVATGDLRALGRSLSPPPGWSFSASGPGVTFPLVWIVSVIGSLPPAGLSVIASGMMPIDSYHEPFVVLYVAVVVTTSPFLSFTRQLSGVAVIETSHETGPAGS